jgi:hypothetical protein
MSIELGNFEEDAKKAVRAFWKNRKKAGESQKERGVADQGTRSQVTAGKNMDGFSKLIVAIAKANGLKDAKIHLERAVLTLPGFFRPTKLWDILITCRGELVAAIELKSQVGPSFGNNFNNRTEEALGTAHDFWVAYREGAFGKHPTPFAGWVMLVEDAPTSRTPVKDKSPHFPILPEFKSACYLQRYDVLCQKLMQEKLYTATALLASPNTSAKTGNYSDLSSMTSLKTFLATFAGHCLATSSRLM